MSDDRADDGNDGQENQPAGQPGSDGQAQGTGAGAGRAFSQGDVDRIVADRLERDRRSRKPEPSERERELEAQMAQFQQAEQERQRAAMTEAERARAEAEEAKQATAAAQAERDAAKLEVLRGNLLRKHGADLPPVYADRVTGKDDEAIANSIARLREEWGTDQRATAAQLLADHRSMTKEQFEGKYGEDVAKALAGEPQSVSGPSNAGTPPAPNTQTAIARGMRELAEGSSGVSTAEKARRWIALATGRADE